MITRQRLRNSLLLAALREHHGVIPVSPHRVDLEKREVDGFPVYEIARWIAESKWDDFDEGAGGREYFKIGAIATRNLEDDFMRCLDWLSRTGVCLGGSNNWLPLRAEIDSLLGEDGCDYLEEKAYHTYEVRRWRRRKREVGTRSG